MAKDLQELTVSSNCQMAKLVPEDVREKQQPLGGPGHSALLGTIFVTNA